MTTEQPTWPGTDERLVPMRLQRFLARAGVASRRKSEDLMSAGRVTVNGAVVTELGSKVDPARDTVAVDGIPVRLDAGSVVLMLNKPAGYLTTMSDPRGRHCVAELVPSDEYPGLFPVGRLDYDTTGLLLFTTDGALAQRLLHPSHHVDKHYVALVEGALTRREIELLEQGVELDDGPAAPAKVDFPASDRWKWMLAARDAQRLGAGWQAVGLTIHEGRKRQVKRMMFAVGHPVVALHRDRFAGLALGGVAAGKWRMLTGEERRIVEEWRA